MGRRRVLLTSIVLSAALGTTMAEGQGLVELTAEQIKQRGEIEIGAFAQVEAQVDRFYRDQKFGEGRVGDRLLSNEIVSSYEDGLAGRKPRNSLTSWPRTASSCRMRHRR